MFDSNRINKDVCCKNENKISMLIKKVKTLEFKIMKDFILASNLSESIYVEWRNLRNKHTKNLRKKKIIIEHLCAEYEAKEELIVSLLCLLNQKIINYILPAESNYIE